MNNISDKNVIILVLTTILVVFGLIFTAKSPERKVIDSPIIWKEEYKNTSIINNQRNGDSKFLIFENKNKISKINI